MTDELAQKLIPKASGDKIKDIVRAEIIVRVAGVLQRNGSFTLACKLFTQAKQKVKAMQCLMHSNDTKKIIAFATTARNKEVYVLAANYLQNSDWHNDPQMMTTIISFYTKAQAFESLAGFYDSCA